MSNLSRSALLLATAVAACSGSSSGRDDAGPGSDAAAPSAQAPAPFAIHIRSDPNYMDTAWCHISFVPVQDPIFPTIRRDRFDATDDGIVVTPADWLDEAKTRVPQLQAAADARTRQLLDEATRLVGRPFAQRDFDFLLYQCPYFGGGSAIPGIFPLFPYLRAAVGDLAWPDWIFTDEYLFHEILHRYAMEKIDYAVGTPILNAAYTALAADASFYESVTAYLGRAPSESEMVSFVGLVLTHIHVYALLTRTYQSLDEADDLDRIRTYETENANPHPSYVKAWAMVGGYEAAELDAVLAELR